MNYLTHNPTKLISTRFFSMLIVLLGLGLTGLTASPSSACCYDPPDNDDTSNQMSPPSSTDLSSETGQGSTAVPYVPEDVQLLSYSDESSDQQGSNSASVGAGNFLQIRLLMTDGQYLKAKQIAEKRLTTRPFDFQLWSLLQTIYNKLGLQNKTKIASKNAELMDPRWRPFPRPDPPMSQQKRYVYKLLQAIGEYKLVE